jgi:cytochrome c oxidase subunit II
MTRNTFAGAIVGPADRRVPCRRVGIRSRPSFGEKYLAGVSSDCLNSVELREWLRNAPAMKPMYADAEKLEETDGLVRGMPDLALSEDQIDELVAYLLERK